MKSNEGIDKIKVIINPLVLNRKKIHFNQDHIMHIHPHNHLTLHEEGAQVCLAIHYEYLMPFFDMRLNIANAIYYLMEKGIVFNTFDTFPKEIVIVFIYNYLSNFVIHIPQLEFFFNIKEENIFIKEEAVAFGYLRKVVNGKSSAVSYYSVDYRSYRDSMIIIYHKAFKEVHDNHKSIAEIASNSYKIRLEFRLNNINCKRLHLDNLKGTYNDIINRFIPFLAIKYNELMANYVEINPVDNYYLSKLLVEANRQETVKRYTGKELKKASAFPKEYLKPHQIENRDEKGAELLGDFSRKNEIDKTSKKAVKIKRELAKNGVL
jgi:hypothetical protein